MLFVPLTPSHFQDGRLQIDDQIIEVNGEPLIGKSNTAAMGILRGAMQRNCVTKRYISVLVCRDHRSPDGSSSSDVQRHSSNLEEQRISTSDAPSYLKPGSKLTLDSGAPVVAMRTMNKGGGKSHLFANPLLGHLSDGNTLRNTSYQMATHDSMNEGDSGDQRKAVLDELDSAMETVFIIFSVLFFCYYFCASYKCTRECMHVCMLKCLAFLENLESHGILSVLFQA